MEWIVLGFLLIHLLLLFGVLIALIKTLAAQRRQSKSGSHREQRAIRGEGV